MVLHLLDAKVLHYNELHKLFSNFFFLKWLLNDEPEPLFVSYLFHLWVLHQIESLQSYMVGPISISVFWPYRNKVTACIFPLLQHILTTILFAVVYSRRQDLIFSCHRITIAQLNGSLESFKQNSIEFSIFSGTVYF